MNASITHVAGLFLGWLADYYLAATLVLLAAFLAWRWMRQPAHRIAIAWTVLFELLALAVVCALPFWPKLSLFAASAPQPVAELPAEPPRALAREKAMQPPMRLPPIVREKPVYTVPAKRDAPVLSTTPAPPKFDLKPMELFFIGYLTSVALVGLWLVWGALAAALVCRKSSRASDPLCRQLSEIVRDGGKAPRLLVSSRVPNAVALGVLRPTIILPAGLAESGPPETIRAVLAHEWAHIRNRDLWLLALGRLLLMVFFAHPLFWWLKRAIRSNQELLADALAAGENRHDYAEELLHLVRSATKPSPMSVSTAVGIWEGPSQLSRRIAMLLDETFHIELAGSRRFWFRALGVFMLLGAACSLLTLQPSRSTGQQNQPAAIKSAKTPQNAAEESPWKITFPNGEVIELIGLAEHPSEGKPWWKPDGSPLLQRPYFSKQKYFGSINDGRRSVELAWRIDFPSSTVGCRGWSHSISGSSGKGSIDGLSGVYAEAILIPSNQNIANIRVGTTAGPFALAGKLGPKGGKLENPEFPAAQFSTIKKPNGELVVEAILSFAWDDNYHYRLVVVGNDGTEEIWEDWPKSVVPNENKRNVVFDHSFSRRLSEHPLISIKEMRFEYQSRQFVEIKNVSLRPGEKTDVEIISSGSESQKDPNKDGAAESNNRPSGGMTGSGFYSHSDDDDDPRKDIIVLPNQQYQLLMQSCVLKELKITDEQNKKLQEIQAKNLADDQKFFSDNKNLPQAESLKAYKQWHIGQKKKIQKLVEEVFSPEQTRALAELNLGNYAFQSTPDPNFQEKYGVSAEQKTKLAAIQKEMSDWCNQATREKNAKSLALLTPQKRAQLQVESLGPEGVNLENSWYDAEKLSLPSLYPYPDFDEPRVQKELGLSADQQERARSLLGGIANLKEAFLREYRNLPAEEQKKLQGFNMTGGFFYGMGGGGDLSPEEQKKRLEEFYEKIRSDRKKQRAEREKQPLMKVRADLLEKFQALLSPEQLAAYKEMAFRDIAERAINDAALLAKIGADDRQQAEIKKLFDDYMANYQQRALEASAKTLKLLTPPQVEKLREQQEKLRKQLDGEEPPPTPDGGFSTGFVGSSQSDSTTTRIGEKSDEKSDGESKKKDSPPESDKSKTEKSGKASLPAYIVEPPDILSVEMPKLKPLPPYHIGTSDVLQIRASSAIPGQPIDNLYLVEAEGVVNLGSAYGSVKVVGMSIEDATKAIQRKLADVLHNSDISVQLARTAGTQPVTGQYLVGPDGTINMRTYGVAKVAGMNAAEIKKVLEKHLAQFFDAPEVSVDIVGYNSKVYYVITGGAGTGDNVQRIHITDNNVQRIPVTGNETVLDALATVGGPSRLSGKKVWIARPKPDDTGGEQILPVDYAAITNGGSAATNYQIMPGDRVFIAEEKIAPQTLTVGAKIENKIGDNSNWPSDSDSGSFSERPFAYRDGRGDPANWPVTVIEDQDAIAAKLTKIRDKARWQEKVFDSVRIKGIFQPNDEAFEMAIQNGKRRYDLEVVYNGSRHYSHWLDDGMHSYAFSENLLIVQPTVGNSIKWAGIFTSRLVIHFLPEYEGEMPSVSEFCGLLIDKLRKGEEFGKKSPWTLQLNETAHRVEIEIRLHDHGDGITYRHRYALDSDKKYVLTRYRYKQQRLTPAGEMLWTHDSDCQTEFREYKPGIYFPSKGTFWQKSWGPDLEKAGKAREGKGEVAVDSFEIGNFRTEKDFFDVHSWPPIKPGIKVLDQRVKPDREFTYEGGSFDKEVLKIEGNGESAIPPASENSAEGPVNAGESKTESPTAYGYYPYGTTDTAPGENVSKDIQLPNKRYFLLVYPGVGKNLKITEDQTAKLMKIRTMYLNDGQKYSSELSKLSEKERSETWKNWEAEQEKKTQKLVEEILTPEQLRALDEYNLRDEEIKNLGGRIGYGDDSAEGVYFQGSKITDAGLDRCKRLTQFSVIDLAKTDITDAGMKNLEGMKNLKTLYLWGTKVTDAGLKSIAGLTQLEGLALGGLNVTDAGLEHVKGLKRLRTLSLTMTKVTDAGLEKLQELTELRELQIGYTGVTDAGLKKLTGLTRLEKLTLSHTRVTGGGLENFPGLILLDLSDTNVADAGLENLKGLNRLAMLGLTNTQITDAGLIHLKALRSLSDPRDKNDDADVALLLNKTNVTDAGLKHLYGLISLTGIDLTETKVTAAGVRKLMQALPNCHIGPEPSDKKPEEQKTPPPVPAESKTENKDYTFPISVSGRAMDLEGKPIAGAKIYLASLRVDWKRLAETTTDGQGRYEFRDVPLPIERRTTNNRRDGGAFEIFGQASGYGFAWRPQKYFYPQPNGDTFIAGEDADMPVTFQVGEKIELDLKFPPPAKIRGRIVDDRGQPIPNAELAIRSCEPIRPDGYPTPEIFHIIWSNREFQSPNERETVPPEIKIRKTDADGRFEFTGLPPDCRFFIDVRPAGFAGRTVCAGTCEPSRKGIAGLPMFPGTMDLKFAKIREVTVQVLYSDTRKPAPKVFVCANNKEAGTGVASDNEGRALLRLPPGKYDLELLPAKGTPYLLTNGKIEVPKRPAKEPTVVELRPAAVVEVQVLDAVTGKGVADVDLWREITQLPSPDSYSTVQKYHEVHFFRSYEQETNICHVERPRTDSNGALRALFEPGKHRIGVAKEAFPEGYEAVETEGQEIDAQAGKPIKITFHLKKK